MLSGAAVLHEYAPAVRERHTSNSVRGYVLSALIITLHILACIILVVLVLLQPGKEGMGVVFGGGSGSLFGSAGAGGLLIKLTVGAAVIFFATSLTLTFLTTRTMRTTGESIILEMERAFPSAREGIYIPDRENAGQQEQDPVNRPAPGPGPAPGN
jgi:preprotein translocase subunit SecG